MDTQNIKKWFITEFGIDEKHHNKIDTFLDMCQIFEPSSDNKLIIRWGEYCGRDKQLAGIIDNLNKLVPENEFKWKAHEVSWWWNNFFKCKCMVNIQVMSQCVGLCYYNTRNTFDNSLIVEPIPITSETKKLDGVWQDFMNKIIERKIVELSIDEGNINKTDLLNKLTKGMSVMISSKGSIESFHYLNSKLLNFTEELKKKEVHFCFSEELNSNEIVVSDKKKGLIFCPYTLGQHAILAEKNKFKYLLRYNLVDKQNEYFPYKKYIVEEGFDNK